MVKRRKGSLSIDPALAACGALGAVLLAAAVFLNLRQAQPGAVAPPRAPLVKERPPPSSEIPKGKGKIAIVLDDWGYSVKQMPLLESIRQPVTVAVLPGLPYSTQVAQRAHFNGDEVILHQPMEAEDPNAPREAAELSAGMSKEEVRWHLNRSLEAVPFARGISNHQGSKATADPALMEKVFTDVKRRRLYFLDSFVTSRSVCLELACRLKLRFARRAVFLDNDPTADVIRQRLVELAKAASASGEALGIGHDRPRTLEVLLEMIPALEKAGYTFVPVSRLARIPEDKNGYVPKRGSGML